MAAGQVTDDSELAMCLMHGLIDDNVPAGLPEKSNAFYLDNIAKYYRSWYMSDPFDIGQNTSTALSALVKIKNGRCVA